VQISLPLFVGRQGTKKENSNKLKLQTDEKDF
jgi:hypothetical protein